MSDYDDYRAQLELEQQQREWAEAEARRAYARLGLTPTGAQLHTTTNRIQTERLDPRVLPIHVAAENRPAIAQHWLQDPQKRAEFRTLLRGSASELEGLAATGGPDYRGLLRSLESVPIPFIRPDMTVHPSEVDTPEERAAWLARHDASDPLNESLLQAAVDWGGLGLEATPFGTVNSPGRGLKWRRSGGGGGMWEDRARQTLAGGGTLSLSDLSALANERIGQFRLHDPRKWQHLAGRVGVTLPFAIAGGYAGAGLGAAALGAAAGAGVGAPAAASTATLGLPAWSGGALTGASSGLVGGAAGSAIGSGGDPNAVWQGAVGGAATGGLGGAIPPASNAALGAGRGAGLSALGNLINQGVKGHGIDWATVLQAGAIGAGSGAAQGAWPGGDSGLDRLTSMGMDLGKGFGNALLTSNDPLASLNQQIDRGVLDRETAMQDQMATAQAAWKRRYAEASAAQQAAMQEAMRAAQQAWESKVAERKAQIQAWITARQDQITEALRQMGEAEPGIASLMSDWRADLAAQHEAAEAERQQVIASRQFFPSLVQDQAPGTDPFATSSVLVPHSPPAVQFGMEGLPASFGSYGAPAPPQFSAEGFLPSGALAPAASPAVNPLPAPRRRPAYPYLGGLARSPYLMRA